MCSKIQNANTFLGSVIRPISIYSHQDLYVPSYFQESDDDLVLVSYKMYRYILFQMNDQQQLTDLLYYSPSYPVLGLETSKGCLSSPIIINDVTPISFSGTNPEAIREVLLSQRDFLVRNRDLFTPHPNEGKIKQRNLEFIDI